MRASGSASGIAALLARPSSHGPASWWIATVSLGGGSVAGDWIVVREGVKVWYGSVAREMSVVKGGRKGSLGALFRLRLA